MPDFKIEKGVPLAPLPHGREAKYPWDQMDKGDSFVIPEGKPSVVSSANKRYKTQGKKFTARQLKDPKTGEAKTLRVWRVQ